MSVFELSQEGVDAVRELLDVVYDIAYGLPTKARLALGPSVAARAQRALQDAHESLGDLTDEDAPLGIGGPVPHRG